MRAASVFAVAVLVAGCSFSRGEVRVHVDRNPGQPGGWEATDGDVRARVDAEGEHATVRWLGRTFHLRNVPRFRGTIGSHGVHLRIDIHELVIDREQLSLRTRDRVQQRKLEALPDPMTIRFQHGGARFTAGR